MRKAKGDVATLSALLAADPLLKAKTPDETAVRLLTKDFAGRIGIPSYVLTNMGAEIRRLKAKQVSIPKVQAGFDSFVVHPSTGEDIGVELVDGQIQVEYPWKPCEESRRAVKRLAFKWSSYSKRWVRKHTESTCGEYFRQELIKALAAAKK